VENSGLISILVLDKTGQERKAQAVHSAKTNAIQQSGIPVILIYSLVLSLSIRREADTDSDLR
jgi:hypothetical protein